MCVLELNVSGKGIGGLSTPLSVLRQRTKEKKTKPTISFPLFRRHKLFPPTSVFVRLIFRILYMGKNASWFRMCAKRHCVPTTPPFRLHFRRPHHYRSQEIKPCGNTRKFAWPGPEADLPNNDVTLKKFTTILSYPQTFGNLETPSFFSAFRQLYL